MGAAVLLDVMRRKSLAPRRPPSPEGFNPGFIVVVVKEEKGCKRKAEPINVLHAGSLSFVFRDKHHRKEDVPNNFTVERTREGVKFIYDYSFDKRQWSILNACFKAAGIFERDPYAAK